MNSPETNNNIANIGKNDPEALAKVVGVMPDLHLEQPAPAVESGSARSPEKRRTKTKEALMGLGIVAAAAFLVLPRASGDIPAPEKNFLEHAQDQAQIPLGEGDEIVIDGIKFKNSGYNTPSEAILNDPRVVDLMAKHPDEVAGIEQSALGVPASEKYVGARRDVNKDGKLDIIIVPDKR